MNAAVGHDDAPRLVGRDAELERIFRHFEQSRTSGETVVVRGAAGVGVSRVLGAACAVLRAAGADVWFARASPEVPFGLMREWLAAADVRGPLPPSRDLSAAAISAVGCLDGATEEGHRALHSEGGPELVRRGFVALLHASRRRVVLVADDVEACDPESRSVLRGLIEEGVPVGALLLLGDHAGAAWADAAVVNLSPLDDVSPREPCEATLARLSPEAQSVARRVAVLRQPFLEQSALALCACDTVELSLHELVDAKILESYGGGRFRFCEPRDRASVLQTLGALAAPAHREAAAFFAKRDEPAERAFHLEKAAACEPEDRATLLLCAAESWLVAGLSTQACRAALGSLRADPAAHPVETLVILAEVGDAVLAESDTREVALSAIAELPNDPVAGARARLLAARVLAVTAHHAAVRLLTHEATALRPDDDATATAALDVLVQSHTQAGHFARAAEIAKERIDRGRSPPLAFWLSAAISFSAVEQSDDALDALMSARRLAIGLARESALARSEMLVALFLEDVPASVKAAERALELARVAGMIAAEAVALHNLGDVLHRCGRVGEARAALEASQKIARAREIERLIDLNEQHLAYLDAIAGNERALSRIRSAIARARARGHFGAAVDGGALEVRFLARARRWTEAVRAARSLLPFAEEQGQLLAAREARRVLRALDR